MMDLDWVDNVKVDNKAEQIYVAVGKIYLYWKEQGEVFDNVTNNLVGFEHDISDCANWLDQNTDMGDVLSRVSECTDGAMYSALVDELMARCTSEYLAQYSDEPCVGNINNCKGKYSFVNRQVTEADLADLVEGCDVE